MQLFSADTKIFLKQFEFFLRQKVEKTNLRNTYFSSSSLLPWAGQTALTEEFQNVAYRPTVYKTGAIRLEGLALVFSS